MSILGMKTARLPDLPQEVLNRVDFDGTRSPMWIFDTRTFAFLAVNDAAVHDYGYSREQFLSMTILDIRPSEDIIPLLRSELLEGRRNSDEVLWTHRKRDGSLIEVEITSRETTFKGRPAEIVLVREVTENPASGRCLQTEHSQHQPECEPRV